MALAKNQHASGELIRNTEIKILENCSIHKRIEQSKNILNLVFLSIES